MNSGVFDVAGVKQRMYELDYFRILGAFGVLMYHYSFRTIWVDGIEQPLFPLLEVVSKYGYLGVNLFFMISGFVILMSATSKSASVFAVSRVDRLFPAYWAAVTLTTIFLIISGSGVVEGSQYLFNLTMLNDYIGIKDIDGVYWTLHVELKFYFIIFLLILFGKINKIAIWLPCWTAVSVLYAFCREPFFMGWFISPSYSAYFIAGISFFMIMENKRSILYHSIAAISLLLALYHAPNQISGFIANPTDYDIYMVLLIIGSLYFFFFLFSANIIRIRTDWSLVTRLSSLTYLIYLIHAKIGKSIFDYFSAYIPQNVTLLLVIAIVVSVSELLYRFVEKNMAGKIRLMFG